MAFGSEAPGAVESVAGVGDFFGVGLGLGGVAVAAAPPAPEVVADPAPVLGGFFVSAPVLLMAAPGVVAPVPAAGGFNGFVAGVVAPVPTGGGFSGWGVELGVAVPGPVSGGFHWTPLPFFWSAVATAGFGALAGVGEGVAPGTPVVVAPGAFGAFGSCLGTLGSLWERMSAARIGSGPVAVRESSTILVMTKTSSSRLRSAAGLILMAKNGSLSRSGVDEITVPTAYPLG